VRPDSRLLLNVMKEIVSEEDFQERLDSVRERVDEIEVSHPALIACTMLMCSDQSLHRTRELTLKDKPDSEGVFRFMLAPTPKPKRSSWFSSASTTAAEADEDS